MPKENRFGFRENGSIQNGGMGVLIEKDMVARTHQAGDDTDIGAVPRGEEDAGLFPFETREFRFEFAVYIEDAAQDRPAWRLPARICIPL